LHESLGEFVRIFFRAAVEREILCVIPSHPVGLLPFVSHQGRCCYCGPERTTGVFSRAFSSSSFPKIFISFHIFFFSGFIFLFPGRKRKGNNPT
jgi:hypothetical protein